MPIKGVKFCGAKCRTKGGAPCEQPGMQNGRCRMHGGTKPQIHGRLTLKARAERRQELALLREMQGLNQEIERLANDS